MRTVATHDSPAGAVRWETDGSQHAITSFRRAFDGHLMHRPLASEVVREQAAGQAFRDHVWQLEQHGGPLA